MYNRAVLARWSDFDVMPSLEERVAYLEGRFGVRSEINVYVSERDAEVTGQPIQTEIVPILKIK